ncbi:MAG TPA: DUF3817 domain-containing protein [Naasia sp.]
MPPRRLFRSLALLEAVTWTLLLAGLLQKYAFDAGDWGVSVGGALHGFVFLAYAATAVLTAWNQRWNLATTAVAVVSAVVPYATIPVERWLDRSGRLVGGWRTESTEDPRDARPLDRFVRWFLRRPAVLAAVLVAGVAVVFVVLLILGPPGGR